MKIYFAGIQSNSVLKKTYSTKLKHLLVSYIYGAWLSKIEERDKYEIMLDSSAFSINNNNKWKNRVDIYTYMDYINKHRDFIDVYINFDDMLSRGNTRKNQSIMEDAGLSPMPVYHYGEPVEVLRDYLIDYDYVGYGGTVGHRKKYKISEEIKNAIDEIGINKKIHLFGYASPKGLVNLKNYIHSSDSTKWVVKSRFGETYEPMGKVTKHESFDRYGLALSNIESTIQLEEIINGE